MSVINDLFSMLGWIALTSIAWAMVFARGVDHFLEGKVGIADVCGARVSCG